MQAQLQPPVETNFRPLKDHGRMVINISSLNKLKIVLLLVVLSITLSQAHRAYFLCRHKCLSKCKVEGSGSMHACNRLSFK